MRPGLLLAGLVVVSLAGCGGSKADFSTLPQSYTPLLVSPPTATAITLGAISRDGRVVGEYTKDGKPYFFGWSSDGSTTDLTPPVECKQLDGINEIGNVACTDRSASPTKLFLWRDQGTGTLALPQNMVDVQIEEMTIAGIATTCTNGSNATRGFLLDENQDPQAESDLGGTLRAISLSGNLAGTETVGGDVKAFTVLGGTKGPLVGQAGTDTIPYGIDDNGVVAATRGKTGGPFRAVRIVGTVETDLPMPQGATETKAWDVDTSGIIVGSALVGGKWTACAWFPKDGPKLLKNLASVPQGVTLTDAKRVTPLGIVVCIGTKTTGQTTVPVVYALQPNY